MTRSLKERYETRQLKLLKERVIDVDRQLIEENKTARLIIEAMDQETLSKVGALVQKLEVIKNAAGDDLKGLVGGIDQAQAELNKYTAGGPLAKAWTKLKGVVGIDNPIVKITTFSSALEQGFRQLPQILKNNGISEDDLRKDLDSENQLTLRDAIVKQFVKKPDATADALDKTRPKQEDAAPGSRETATGSVTDVPPNANDVQNSGNAEKAAKGKLNSVISQLQKALSPAGVFGAFKKVPYVDSAALAQDLLNAHLSRLIAVSKAVTSGPQSGELASAMKGKVAGGGGEVGTASTDKTGESAPTRQASPPEPAKSPVSPSDPTPAGQKPANGPGQRQGGGSTVQQVKLDDAHVKDMARFVSKQSGVDTATTYKILTALNNAQKLRQ